MRLFAIWGMLGIAIEENVIDTEDLIRMDILRELPDSARVWVFSVQSTLLEEQEAQLGVALANLIQSWKAHGSRVVGGYDIVYRTFVIIGADESLTEVSGCSIDSVTRGVRNALAHVNATLADESDIFFRDQNENILHINRLEFRSLAEENKVSAVTTVFNNTVATLSDLRQGKWECKAKDSWHARAFKL